MSSILTNTSAMVALQTLKGITMNLEKTQSEISTGKSVANARDNAAVWAISKVMESDVQGFKGISDSLALGSSTVSVARSASETVTDLLTQMKGKIVASQESNVDRAKIQTDIVALRDQIGAVVGAAQFNGLNLLSNQSSTAGSQSVDILSSLDRSGSGVAVSEITVAKNDIGIKAAVDGATAGGGANTAIATLNAGATQSFMVISPANVAYGTTYNIEAMGGSAVAAANQVSYVTRNGDTAASVAAEMVNRLNFVAQREGRTVSFAVNATDATQIDITNTSTTTAVTGILATDIDRTTGGTAGGGLNLLQKFDVTTSNGANAALAGIEGLIQTSIKSAASFGSVQGRIDTQQKFVDSLTGSLKAGIGTLVDANMEETSARLQALQVQQQLGVQALSIANQSPQSILSLFR